MILSIVDKQNSNGLVFFGKKKHGNMVDPLTATPCRLSPGTIGSHATSKFSRTSTSHNRTIEALMVKMMEEVRAWCLAGAKRLREFVLGA